MQIGFVVKSIVLGIGLATDASIVAVSNGVSMKNSKKRYYSLFCAFIFGFLQGFMPLIGFFIGYAFIFIIEKWLGFIALCILSFLGANSIISAKNDKNNKLLCERLNLKIILLQGVATSLDALSVGIIFANYSLINALICSFIIALTTTILCFVAFCVGKRLGKTIGDSIEILGGILLILIGIHIFITSFTC